jgi:predicted nucleotidyltransferase
MTSLNDLDTHRELVHSLAAARGVTNLRVFHPALHGGHALGRGVELLVDVQNGVMQVELSRLKIELAAILGCRVEMRTPSDFPESIRHKVLAEARPL